MFAKFDRRPGKVVLNHKNILYAFEQIDPDNGVCTGVGVMFKGNQNVLTIKGITLDDFEAGIKSSCS